MAARTAESPAAADAPVSNVEIAEWLHEYYGPHPSNFEFYLLCAEGSTMVSSILTRADLCQINAPLESLRMPCKHETESFDPLYGSKQYVLDRREALFARVKSKGVRIDDKPLYRLVALDRAGLTFSGSVYNGFLKYARSSSLLFEELCDEVPQCRDQSLRGRFNTWRRSGDLLRNKVLPRDVDFSQPSNWLCCGGFGVLMAFNTGRKHTAADGRVVDEYEFPLQTRSVKVADGRNKLALIPKGFHQPTNADFQGGHSLRHAVFREFGEELFDLKEAEDLQDEVHCDAIFHQHPGLHWFIEEENTASFSAELVSFGLNTINGNYDYGVLVVVKDPQYYQQYFHKMKKNWEGKELQWTKTWDKERIRNLVLMSDAWTFESLFHFCECLTRLKALLGDGVDLPSLERVTPVSGVRKKL
ncbi:MAG: hypothetical protein WC655_27145 [Candidatus Hydrogenedentales bacterium]